MIKVNFDTTDLLHTRDMCKDGLFEHYVEICNKALDINKDKFPFGQILCSIQQVSNITPKHVRIIDDTGEPDFYLIVEERGISCQKTCGSCRGSCSGDDTVWKVKTSYLNDVISNPDRYIENPAKLDWGWITPKQY